jgi:hypothetical protein
MSMRMNWKKLAILGSYIAALGLISGCNNDGGTDAEETGTGIAPLVVDGAEKRLVGTYEVSTGYAWMTESILTEAKTMAEEQGVVDPRVVVAVKDSQHAFHVDEGSVAMPAELAEGTRLDAYVIEPSTALRWTLVDFRVGSAAERDVTLVDVVPSSSPLYWPPQHPPSCGHPYPPCQEN